ncbi:Protein-tyrosine phosphatase, receptor/non-receptor type domain and Protein-tyrosine/Dual specificity phosphatase domain and Protein-tyrosine phosphatase, catalytic domain-containing protein [Strongyloides ratti]|uniref:Protein-tyrosine phosphatase, receptor/non-receptor type domain and Protein-tyrosine/Dual specificity phosphatase domain and Protein-tyrosine phosphatase, catalytic domain-containing protein n=1 Tax=Strongyloides ratti TaxID=34506 RepID=A0A090MV98_STRRB|nr:Protein-tyrosine phosphatase, receptor/non-receptor type domain and Protein-tyrosine/Dual specificity phosphatase domain and Protein-tyrosine phosphatase, catalytic domain-containing protein [Strongyloides ratti]CEF62753.1 Protein-tyrosine phosphatase, receptor/non-receptor type domain and Protein-tyrosine/Dual specificity phosphatase domain and Protein-tyrosine phosphatase, catalytic domain-containing protein [Strongyloides ratti]
MSAPVRPPQKHYSPRTPEHIKIDNIINGKKKINIKKPEGDEKDGNKKNYKIINVGGKIYDNRRPNDSCPILKTKGTSNVNLNNSAKCGSLNNQNNFKSKTSINLSERNNKKKQKVSSINIKEEIKVPQNYLGDNDHGETNDDDLNVIEKRENIFALEKNTVEQYDKRKDFCNNLLAIKNFRSLLICPAFKDPKYKPTDYTKKAWLENPSLNRFNDVFCIDSTRVILKRYFSNSNKSTAASNLCQNIHNQALKAKKKNDYIHANYVKIPFSDYVYICTQGPLQNTIEDFLLMCWQEDSKVIVMLCELKEDDTEKCCKYWPEAKEVATFGRICVYNEREDTRKYEGIVIRTLKIQLGETKKVIIQFQLKSWPDHLVPSSSTILVTLLREVQLISSRNPIVVHCSAGIGRTGTFIGIHYASERFKNQKNEDITLLDVIREIRSQRLQSIQTTIQYAYLNICLLEYFALDNIIEYDDNVKQFINKNISFIQEYARRLLAKRTKVNLTKNKDTQE